MNKKPIFFILSILLLSIIILKFDDIIVKFFVSLQNNPLNTLFLIITFLSSGILIFIFVTFLSASNKNKRKWIIPSWITLALSAIVSFLLKFFIQRKRPFQLNLVPIFENMEKVSHSIWNFSFPSFQALMVFSLLPLISKEFPKLKKFWIVFASLVALSRVYFGVHFLSDVLLGSLMGYLIGLFIISLENKNKIWKKVHNKVKDMFKK